MLHMPARTQHCMCICLAPSYACLALLAGPLFSQLPVLRSFLRELKPQLGSAAVSAALAATEELAELGQLLKAWGLAPGQLLLEPLLTPHSEHFSGVLFQVGVCGGS
jgi:hypothetical protein